MDRQELIDSLRDFLYCRNEVLFAYIFGSHAKKKNKNSSDIDIAVYIDKTETSNLQYRLQLINKLQDLLDIEVDLIIMNKTHPLLLHEIFKHGINIKDFNHDLLIDFRKRSFYRYLDYVYMSDIIFKKNKYRIIGDLNNG